MPTNTSQGNRRFNRHVRFQSVILDGIAIFKSKSFSRPDVTHQTEIDLRTGKVQCSCEHGQYRMAGADLGWTKGLCIHATRAKANIIARAKAVAA